MRILLVTSEYEGLVKVGGLSDFSAAMAAALARQGHDVRVLLPHYAVTVHQPYIDSGEFRPKTSG